MLVILLVCGIITAIYMYTIYGYLHNSNRTLNKSSGERISDTGKSIAKYSRWFNTIEGNFLFRSALYKIRDRLANLACYSPEEVIIYSVEIFKVSVLQAVGSLVVIAFVYRDLFSVLLMIPYLIILQDTVVFERLDNIRYRLILGFKATISSVRQKYMQIESIPESISDAEIDKYLGPAFEDIYVILTSINPEVKLEEFYESNPFVLLQTFAGVAYLLNDLGDTKTETGQSNFLEAINMITQEIDLEANKILFTKKQFGYLKYLPIVPLFLVGITETYMSSLIPATSVIYKGVIGNICKILIVFASTVGYLTVTKINGSVTVKPDDRSHFIQWLLSKPRFKKFIRNIEPKLDKELMVKERLIETSLSNKSVDDLYATKFVMAFITMILTISLSITAISLGKSFVYNNVRSLSATTNEKLNRDDERKRRELDIPYLKREICPTEEETEEIVKAAFPRMEQMDVDEQVERMMKKYNTYHRYKYYWWMLLICYLATYIAWNVPEWMLRGRGRVIARESEEDVLQMQTLICVLMNTSMDTLQCLYWLQRQSRLFKGALIRCYHDYPSDPELALDTLKREGLYSPEFIRLIDRLALTIHQISLKDAFSNLTAERVNMMEVRKILQNANILSNRAFVSPISKAALYLYILCYALLPMGIVGLTAIGQALNFGST